TVAVGSEWVHPQGVPPESTVLTLRAAGCTLRTDTFPCPCAEQPTLAVAFMGVASGHAACCRPRTAQAFSYEGLAPRRSAVCLLSGSGPGLEANEDVEVDRPIGVPSLCCGEDLAEHVTPPEHRPEHRRAHACRLENLLEIGDLIRVREDQRALVLRHPSRM